MADHIDRGEIGKPDAVDPLQDALGRCKARGHATRQIDLPRGTASGLADAERILKGVKGVSFNYFDARDVVRHPLVARIIEAYDRAAGDAC